MLNEEEHRRIGKEVYDAIQSADLAKARRLLLNHPECLRELDGTQCWLMDMAHIGNLDAIKMFVGLGVNVNESSSLQFQATAIQSAAMLGNVEIVRWLLDHGALINIERECQITCPALSSAARNGHIDTVKLLVERGADLRESWMGFNAMMHAELNGHKHIADYLRSLGVNDVRETTPPDYATTHKFLLEILTANHGPACELKINVPGEPHIAIHRLAANPQHESFKGQTLFTIGLSDHRLPTPSDAFHCSELRMLLPADWPLTEVSLSDPQWNWPVEWLKRIAMELRVTRRLDEYPPFFMNGSPPRPLAPGTRLCGWVGLIASGSSIQVPDWRWVGRMDLYPIYSEEADLIRTNGHDEFANRLQHHQISQAIYAERPNMAEPQFALTEE